MMNRRSFIGICAGISSCLLGATYFSRNASTTMATTAEFVGPILPDWVRLKLIAKSQLALRNLDPHPDKFVADSIRAPQVQASTDAAPDIVLAGNHIKTYKSVLARLSRLQDYVGYGNFNLIGWDYCLRTARTQLAVGAFTRVELDFIEEIFFTDARSLGFYGDKVVTRLSDTIAIKDTNKIPGSGHYLFNGDSTKTYLKIRKEIGNSIILTSGIRGVVKQLHLFLNKAEKVGGNLSLASYSLAPPGHSYHAVGDFDVGKRSFGEKNFSEEFTATDEFKSLSDLGYLNIRYPQNNPFGVRYEPWHIKVV